MLTSGPPLPLIFQHPKRLRLSAFLVLAFAFFCTQQWAVRHWTLHAAASIDASSSKAPAGADRCDDCTALCVFAGGMPVAETRVALAAGSDPLPVAHLPSGASPALRLGFRSRAPPVLS